MTTMMIYLTMKTTTISTDNAVLVTTMTKLNAGNPDGGPTHYATFNSVATMLDKDSWPY